MTDQPSTDPATRASLRDADACVKCGACLPVCPTYARTLHEADSPRGRIGLVQGLLAGRLPADAVLAAHLDGCLQCRFCEAVCPAQVAIVQVIRGGQQRLRAAGVRPAWRSMLDRHAARWHWAVGRLRAWVAPASGVHRGA